MDNTDQATCQEAGGTFNDVTPPNYWDCADECWGYYGNCNAFFPCDGLDCGECLNRPYCGGCFNTTDPLDHSMACMVPTDVADRCPSDNVDLTFVYHIPSNHVVCTEQCEVVSEGDTCDAHYHCQHLDCGECLADPACGTCIEAGVMTCVEAGSTCDARYTESADGYEECVDVCIVSGQQGQCDAAYPCGLYEDCAECLKDERCGVCVAEITESMTCMSVVDETTQCDQGVFSPTATSFSQCSEICMPVGAEDDCKVAFPCHVHDNSCAECLDDPNCGACFDGDSMTCIEHQGSLCSGFYVPQVFNKEECIEQCSTSNDEESCDIVYPSSPSGAQALTFSFGIAALAALSLYH
eukprot:GHVO01045785.1.p1 GENE.GHVO01045785.1~~GHVO01045785.1.p1  ORF type:complete len:372 (+),score=49.47 GHVO01045785.1:60-1118(+)